MLAEKGGLPPAVRDEPDDADSVGDEREQDQNVDDRLDLLTGADQDRGPEPECSELRHLRSGDEGR
jgi:hypothetical protein